MYYFIVNPGSRSGNGRHVWKEVEEILETEDVEYRVFFTSSRCHATRLAREITARDERITLAAVGGDGTVSEVLSGIQDFSKVTFAYIPTGSSNDFARSLGLPSDTAAAVQNLLHPSYFRRIDLGKARLGEQALYFAVSCGCGYDAARSAAPPEMPARIPSFRASSRAAFPASSAPTVTTSSMIFVFRISGMKLAPMP